MKNRTIFALVVLTLVTLACGSSAPRRKLDLYPSPTIIPTQTARVIIISQTPEKTMVPDKKQPQISTQTPIIACFTVSASEAVYLRPAPNADNYPIMPIPNGTQVHDLGGRVGSWNFVALGDKQGWVNGEYLQPCQ